MVIYALDTNTISYYLRGQGEVARRLLATSRQQVVVPSVVVYEARYGLLRRGRAEMLEVFGRFVETMSVLDFDADAAAQAAQIRHELERQGRPIGPMDLLIAATARRHQCTLVTHNVDEFARVPGLVIEDWF